jgi:hypothetical protein
MRRIDEASAEVIKGLIDNGETMIEIDGKKYDVFVTLIDESETTVEEDIQTDPNLKEKLLQAKEDILEGNYYTTEEMRRLIRRGGL